MRYAFLGSLLMVAGIAARIEAARHHPVPGTTSAYLLGNNTTPAAGWSPPTYDLIRIGGWALLIFGAVYRRVRLGARATAMTDVHARSSTTELSLTPPGLTGFRHLMFHCTLSFRIDRR